ncbi:hypothetical protein PG993_003419 [Apiospora rasikravindrae]|uniref:Zn(2)-C6 fungal-type domain-containing protein n=1 Tax=Apiospora rasikravindrae TaxID=990691 RepID=A0ABR1TZH2_9PEZI
MYGIIAFDNRRKPLTGEFRAELRKYRRGSACKGCRTSRSRCSGKLDGTPCDRCQRLGNPCLYTTNNNNQGQCAAIATTPTQRSSHHDNNSSTSGPTSPNSSTQDDSHEKNKQITPPNTVPPEPATAEKGSRNTSDGNSLSTGANYDESQSLTYDAHEFGLDGWCQQLQDLPSMTDFAWPELDDSSANTPRHSSILLEDPQCPPPPRTLLQEVEAAIPGNGGGACSLSSAPQPSVAFEKHLEEGQNGDVGTNTEEATAVSSSAFSFLKSPGGWPLVLEGASGATTDHHHQCLQDLTSSLSMLRCSLARNQGGLEVDLGIRASGVSGGSVSSSQVRADEFLELFEKVFEKLRRAETCPLACMLSQNLAILLLLVVEQLVELMLGFAADLFVGGAAPSLSSSIFEPEGDDACQQNTATGSGSSWRVTIGAFEITDPTEHQLLVKQLLQNRAQGLGAFIAKLSDMMKHKGLSGLETDLRRIREGLCNTLQNFN